MTEPASRKWLAAYALVFAGAGAAFLLAPGQVCRLLGALASAPPPGGGGAALWLGLSGSLMAVLTLLASEVARDPAQPAVWRALLLSKGVSSAVFAVYALTGGGRAFLGAAAVDGAILLHLAFLREAAEPLDAWTPRLPRWGALRHEAFFIILNDPVSGAAFWLRHEADRAGGRCRWAVTDAEGVRQGAWEAAPFAGLERRSATAVGPDGLWRLAWQEGPAPAYALMPRWLWRLGLASTMYVTAAPAAVFSGTVTLGEKTWTLRDAPGCVGHLWGRRHGARWRWAYAFWPERSTIVEALTARGRVGPWLTPPLTSIVQWRDGRLSVARSWSEGTWQGRLEPGLTCTLAHGGVVVRHCTLGTLLIDGLSGPGAVESAEEA